MNATTLLALLLLIAGGPCAAADWTLLKPFKATYEVWLNGKAQGLSVTTLSRNEDGTWRYDIQSEGTAGIARLVGAEADQTTLFDIHDDRPRPLSATSYSRVLLKTTERSGRYDWTIGEARWTGDLKPHRLGPIALQPGDLNTGLINLALVRDALHLDDQASTLDYRLVDEGRIRDYSYRFEANETVAVAGRPYSARRLIRGDAQRRQIAWVVADLPVPARIVDEREGKPGFDFRLLKVE